MKITAPAKVNLMLHFTGRRADGYHLMQSAVAFADIGDELEITPSQAFSLIVDGPFAAHAPDGPDNLVARAARGANIAIRLTKNIPAGAGLGGGSADAAAVLNYLNRQSRALEIGADVPASLKSSAQWVEGIGDRLSPVDMKPMHAVLIWPGQGLSTPAMYAAYKVAGKSFHAPMANPAFIDIEFLKITGNDFTDTAIESLPVIGDVLNTLRDTGAVAMRLSGSGSACFGIYADAMGAKKAAGHLSAAYPDAWVRPCVLR